jgi:predicted transcriptional regulator
MSPSINAATVAATRRRVLGENDILEFRESQVQRRESSEKGKVEKRDEESRRGGRTYIYRKPELDEH